jgi:hypothetical protein
MSAVNNSATTGQWVSVTLTRYRSAAAVVLILAAIGVAAYLVNPEPESQVPSVSVARAVTLVVVGWVAGLLGGLIGTGGCSVMLPAIHFWMDYPASMAVGTTLFAVIFTATSGGYGHLIRRNLDPRAVLWLSGGGIAGVALGSWFFTLLADEAELLGLILGLVFVWPAVRMIWQGVIERGMPQRPGSSIPGPAWGLAIFGFAIGIATGVAGLGGGYALVPGLIYLFGAPVYVTMGTSLATMMPLALGGGGIKFAQGYVAVGAGLLLAVGTVIGAQVGAALIKRFQPATLKLVFGLYFLYVSIKFIAAFAGVKVW